MQNKFRYDGEMPPEIAVQFPVVDKQSLDHSKNKPTTKRPLPASRDELPLFPKGADILGGIVASIAGWGLIVVIVEHWDTFPNWLAAILICSILMGGALALLAGVLVQGGR